MKTNILFVSTGTYAFGESVMALKLARGLDHRRFRPLFLASPLNGVLMEDHPGLISTQLFENAHSINEVLLCDLTGHCPPDLIVLCDFLTFNYSKPLFGITLERLRKFGCPIISLDSYEWESGDFALDFFNGVVKKAPPLLLELEGALRPCPMNKPQPLNGRVACYSFFHQIEALEQSDHLRAAVRREFEVSEGAALFLTAEAVWQKMRPKDYGGRFGALVGDLMASYVDRLDRPVHWIRVGPYQERVRKPKGKVIWDCLPSLPARRFDRLIAGADLVLSTNIASTTLAKAVRYGANALLLYNSVLANGPHDLARNGIRLSPWLKDMLETAYPFHPFLMYPLGWYRFLEPVLDDNPYLDTFHRAQILDEDSVMEKMTSAAEGTLERQLEARGSYERMLAAVPPPQECLMHFVRSAA